MRQASIVAAVLALGVAASAQQTPQGTLRQIIPGHYVYNTTTFNSGVIATSDGVVVLDALASDAVARAAREAITRATGQPVRVLVSSTHHNQYSNIVIAGHGPIPADPRETRQDLRRFRQMLVDVRDSVQKEIARGATEDQAVAALHWPQYAKLQGYDAQRETAIRRLYRQLTGTLP